MSRTTLSIDTPILDEVKRIQRKEGGSLGRVVTRLLSEALVHRTDVPGDPTRLEWISGPMKARVDLADREAVYEILDGKDLATAQFEFLRTINPLVASSA